MRGAVRSGGPRPCFPAARTAIAGQARPDDDGGQRGVDVARLDGDLVALGGDRIQPDPPRRARLTLIHPAPARFARLPPPFLTRHRHCGGSCSTLRVCGALPGSARGRQRQLHGSHSWLPCVCSLAITSRGGRAKSWFQSSVWMKRTSGHACCTCQTMRVGTPMLAQPAGPCRAAGAARARGQLDAGVVRARAAGGENHVHAVQAGRMVGVPRCEDRRPACAPANN